MYQLTKSLVCWWSLNNFFDMMTSEFFEKSTSDWFEDLFIASLSMLWWRKKIFDFKAWRWCRQIVNHQVDVIKIVTSHFWCTYEKKKKIDFWMLFRRPRYLCYKNAPAFPPLKRRPQTSSLPALFRSPAGGPNNDDVEIITND